ncbi:helix-turn-helix domain-containing protein [Leptolyngbya sp. FACHB-36]|uniref:helix-turn-helix domain-containing protein n=1 Tax=Leptolyngbya sp. FACHB-36 TaxID=2692808 RepID=UPI0016811B3C|nr:helix-turn-helix domain-containing protein [Leptolyngbya sp. FACHB-36]MBD2019200.1 helix-turn-helix domain-containing protein [Leptolyngbya sp. FACHB-36]
MLASSSSPFKYELAAIALAEAAVARDEVIAAKYGVSTRTIQRWRNRMTTDSQLACLVTLKKQQLAERWAVDAGLWLQGLAGTVLGNAALPLAKGETPSDRIHSAAGAFKIISEASMGWSALNPDEEKAAQSRAARLEKFRQDSNSLTQQEQEFDCD